MSAPRKREAVISRPARVGDLHNSGGLVNVRTNLLKDKMSTQTNINVIGIFPTPLFIASCPLDVTEMVKFFDSSDVDDTAKEDYGLRSIDTYIINSLQCRDFKSWVEQMGQEFASRVLGHDVTEMGVTQSWVSIKEPNQRHTTHIHPNSIISGVFYWEDGIVDPIAFHKPTIHSYAPVFKVATRELDQSDNDNPYCWNKYFYTPAKNELVLFPSQLSHSVGVVLSKAPRKSLAFNMMPRGKFGDPFSLYELDYSKI